MIQNSILKFGYIIRKRRSITEIGPSPVRGASAAKGNIFFETDL